jgi:hypothetical protein
MDPQNKVRLPSDFNWLGRRDRTSEWRNQNQFDYSTISRRIWKDGSKCPLAISIAWPLLPNKEAAVAGRISLAKSEAKGCARADREGHGVDSTCEFDQHTVTRQRSPLPSRILLIQRRDWLSRA